MIATFAYEGRKISIDVEDREASSDGLTVRGYDANGQRVNQPSYRFLKIDRAHTLSKGEIDVLIRRAQSALFDSENRVQEKFERV